jgi:predicted amidohydrolase
MRVSLLQPRIIRSDIEHNLAAIQRLVGGRKGDLLVLPEYALTGSLVLDLEADAHD